jgi:hypothetical protein
MSASTRYGNVAMTTPHLLSQVGGIIGMADYFDKYLENIPSELQYRQTKLTPNSEREMLAYLLKSPWLDGIQKDIEERSNRFIPKDELLNEMMENTNYDYGGAWQAYGEDMFGFDPVTETSHGYSTTPSGQMLKAPDHKTAWKQIFMTEGGYTPDPPFASPHPSLTRDQAAQTLMGELEPFDPSKHTPQDIGLGGLSTEYLATDFDPEHITFSDLGDPEGLAFNYPTIWFNDNGVPIHLEDSRQAMAQALKYETKTGKKFPRFLDLPTAVNVAKQRSNMGGASKTTLMNSMPYEEF